MLQKQEYLCACVYNIYTYIFIHIQFMFSCWMYFYEILTRTKADKQAFHSNASDHLGFFWITQSHLSERCEHACVRPWVRACVSVCVCACVYTLSNQHPTCYGKEIPLLKSSSSFGFLSLGLQFAHWPETLMAIFYLYH